MWKVLAQEWVLTQFQSKLWKTISNTLNLFTIYGTAINNYQEKALEQHQLREPPEIHLIASVRFQ